jgi:hypothetical protein
MGTERGDAVNRTYFSFQIDQLEAEFERAREEGDGEALRHLREELARRKTTPRITTLRQLLVEEVASQLGKEEAVEEEKGRKESPARPATTGPAKANGGTDQREYAQAERSAKWVTPRSGGQRSGGSVPRSFKPTPQQEQAVEAFKTGESLKINAYAGTGKTSTLQLLAHSTPRKVSTWHSIGRLSLTAEESFRRM